MNVLYWVGYAIWVGMLVAEFVYYKRDRAEVSARLALWGNLVVGFLAANQAIRGIWWSAALWVATAVINAWRARNWRQIAKSKYYEEEFKKVIRRYEDPN